jgi:ribosomal protein L23
MGFFDRFKKRFEKVGQDRGVKHAVGPKDAKAKAEAEKKRQFAAVPSGKPTAGEKKSETGSKKEEKAAVSKRSTGAAPRVLLSAVVTEKSTRLSSMNHVMFEVASHATKHAVAEAVRDLYGITPTDVRIRNTQGKVIRYGRAVGRTRARRTAIVAVPEGKRITVNEGV